MTDCLAAGQRQRRARRPLVPAGVESPTDVHVAADPCGALVPVLGRGGGGGLLCGAVRPTEDALPVAPYALVGVPKRGVAAAVARREQAYAARHDALRRAVLRPRVQAVARRVLQLLGHLPAARRADIAVGGMCSARDERDGAAVEVVDLLEVAPEAR